MTWRHVALAGLALMMAFGVRWWWPSERVPAGLPTLPDPRFDYTLENFSARFTNDEGALELLVSGPKLVHDSATRTAVLDQPSFHLEPDGSDWRGRADLATFQRDEDLLVLEGNVRISQPLPDGETVLTGEQLQHDRRARTISSDQVTEVRRQGTWLRAGGLKMNLDEDHIELSNDLHGQFQAAPALPRDSRPDPAAPAGRTGH